MSSNESAPSNSGRPFHNLPRLQSSRGSGQESITSRMPRPPPTDTVIMDRSLNHRLRPRFSLPTEGRGPGEVPSGSSINPNPNFYNPRGRLTKLFSEDSGVNSDLSSLFTKEPRSSSGLTLLGSPAPRTSLSLLPRSSYGTEGLPPTAQSTPQIALAASRPGESAASLSNFRRVLGTFSSIDGAVKLPVETTSKKRKNAEESDSLDLSIFATPKPGQVVKLETEIRRLEFERDTANKLILTERLNTEEKLRVRRRDEEAATAKATEMWSQAEKIIAENDRLKARIDKAETEAVSTRKKYEDQVAGIKMDNLDKERQMDKDLRETRMENLSLNEKNRTLVGERGKFAEENQLIRQRLSNYDLVLAESRSLKSEIVGLKSQVMVKENQIASLTSANSLLANLPEELRQYRELQVSVPLLQKENQKLREKTALARANEDKIQSLEESVKRYETRQCRFYDLELENEHLKSQIAQWDSADSIQSPTKKPDGIQKLIDRIFELETTLKTLTDEVSEKNRKILDLTFSKRDMEHLTVELKAALKSSEKANSSAEQSLQETSLQLTATKTERDTLRLIKETIDASTSRRDPLTQTKIRDLEERANRSQTLASDFEQSFLKTAAMERDLRAQLDQLQQTSTKELEEAKRSISEFTAENEALKKTIDELEKQSGAWLLRQMKGDFDPATTQVVTDEHSPVEIAQRKLLEEAERIKEENKLLVEKLNQVKATGSYPSDLTMSAEEFMKGPGEQLEELQKQVDKLEKQRNLDMNSFKKTSSNFRQICKDLLGWNVRLDANKVVFRLTDAAQNDTIVFEREDENKPWELRANEYTMAHASFVDEFLRNHQSPPGFFARIILQVLSERTLICLNSPTP